MEGCKLPGGQGLVANQPGNCHPRNYQKELDGLLSSFEKNTSSQSSKFQPGEQSANRPSSHKPSLLLHACCGPCSSYCLEYLTHYFDITVFYYNPNIYPPEEYQRRFTELKNLYTRFPPALEGKVKVVEKAYQPEDFYQAINVRNEPELATEPEKGERCRRCYKFRLQAAFEYACQGGFDYFCTTLSISPFKDAEKINLIGEALQGKVDALQGKADDGKNDDFHKISRWLPSDFKKKGGFKRSLEISREYNLYRQDYCGCIYSKNNRK